MNNWKENFKNWKELILSTSSISWNPNANIVVSLWFFDDKILIADCQMNTTINNLRQNPKIVILSWYIRLKWLVEISNTWKYFDICKKQNENSWYCPKNAILVTINEVFDLDKWEVISQNS